MTVAQKIDAEAAVGLIGHWIDWAEALLAPQSSRSVLRAKIREVIRKGTLPTQQVITAARAGNEDADMALREVIVEMLDHREELPTALAAYNQEALLRAPVSYPPGRNIADTWMRDVEVATLVALAVVYWHPDLPATRNPASKKHSASELVSRALVKRGIKVGERQVSRIHADYAHGKLAEKLYAFIPP